MIKIFSDSKISNLENKVNIFLEENKITRYELHYSTIVFASELRHSILIDYKEPHHI